MKNVLLSIKTILALLFIINISYIPLSCINTNIVGHWADNSNWVELNLNLDSTYTFYLRDFDEQYRYYSFGKWLTADNKLIINSNIQNSVVPLEISYGKLENSNKQICISIILNIFNDENNNENDYVCELFTNDTVPLRKQLTADDVFAYLETGADFYLERCGSYSIYLDTLIDNICFEISRTFFTSTYAIENPIRTENRKLDCSFGDSIIITINVNDDLFNYKVFTNEILKTSNRKIIFSDKAKQRLVILRKVKT